ncbi:MAG TPA: Shedu anti-phage system protein SduA domain-containing protein [Actinophytocola sp.]|uniref:Shedu anti-phage system protein SduA domain-containing protein n=1 Tax=Actinophytocola sp. TaxID=1872138 RepID=UPI002DDCD646|nr:Shedu anti-phage system protein SduA domain-containing protein [Actinophytocola sp.]HEV2780368.1 Shedu anti-phage system protein SduA domain-containing protein [Actinophytocola sp.]
MSDNFIEPWLEYEKRVHEEFGRNGFKKRCVWSGVGEVTTAEVSDFRKILETAPDEKPLQRYIAEHPALLVGERGVPHCRWVIPQPSLAERYFPDFLVARINSGGVRWSFVELETPVIDSLFTQHGHARKQLRQGIKQIDDWRAWCEDNLDIARRPRNKGGLGLTDIYPAPGLVIIGRSDDRTDEDRAGRLRRFEERHQVEIWSYDRLIREAEDRAQEPGKHGSPSCEECGIA